MQPFMTKLLTVQIPLEWSFLEYLLTVLMCDMYDASEKSVVIDRLPLVDGLKSLQVLFQNPKSNKEQKV